MQAAPGAADRLRQYTGLIAAVGALVVFTSWAVSSTLGQRYDSESRSIAEAADDEQFLAYVSELRQNQERLIAIALALRADLRAAHPIADGLADRFPALIDYYQTRGLSSQVRELLLLSERQLAYSKAVGTPTEQIDAVAKSASTFHEELTRRELAIDAQLRSSSADVERLKTEVADYRGYFQGEVGPHLGTMFDTLARAATANFQAGQSRLETVKRNARRTRNIALLLYAVGSVLALGGKFIESSMRKPAA